MNTLIKAISDFQKDCPVIKKEDSGYNYSYTGMESLFSTIKPLMEKHGITHSFVMDFDNIAKCNILELQLFHGECMAASRLGITNNVSLAKMNTFQVLGSGITYLKRYLIVSALGIICTDKDADECLPDNTPPANTDGKDVRSAHTGKTVTGKQIDENDLF